MKKIISILLCLALLFSVGLAETTLNGGEERNITINKAGPNEMEDGISPVTGRYLSDVAATAPAAGFAGQAITGRYMPILMQIDNADGGIGYDEGKTTFRRAPWGAQYCDVIYESPLYRSGETRLTFLFSDLMPDEAGPTRSARVFHAWLREEWDCGFIFYGQQIIPPTSVPEVFKETGADKKADGRLLFRGTDGTSKPWKQYFSVFFPGVTWQPPHDKSANVAALSTLIPADFEANNHTWLFTDAEPDGDEAQTIYVNWGYKDTSIYNSILEWDEDSECYLRYMKDPKGGENPYRSLDYGDKYKGEDITFNNIIVQFTKMNWPKEHQPNPTVLGTGNADYFMCGKHFSGVWNRDTYSDRTVFYDENGDEIELQRGRTLIIVMDYETAHRSVSYE